MKENFENLINKKKYQIFLLSCPAYLPFSFAKHPWFVLNKKGEISRWEIANFKNKKTNNYLYINSLPHFSGIRISFFTKSIFWGRHLEYFTEGDENSLAQKMIEFIENSKRNYPYCNRYFFLGPNSNTYVGWILSKFPEFKIKLGWRFIGKNYKIVAEPSNAG